MPSLMSEVKRVAKHYRDFGLANSLQNKRLSLAERRAVVDASEFRREGYMKTLKRGCKVGMGGKI